MQLYWKQKIVVPQIIPPCPLLNTVTNLTCSPCLYYYYMKLHSVFCCVVDLSLFISYYMFYVRVSFPSLFFKIFCVCVCMFVCVAGWGGVSSQRFFFLTKFSSICQILPSQISLEFWLKLYSYFLLLWEVIGHFVRLTLFLWVYLGLFLRF